jgi:hypothetical protein
MTGSSVTVGEVHTGLLHHSTAVSGTKAAQLLDVVPGVRVARSDRPISHVTSPSVLTGVDCLLPTVSGARVHAVGTVASRASLIGGRILQSAAYATVCRGPDDRRLPWSHYLAHPGEVQTLTKMNADQVAHGFLDHAPAAGYIDLDAIGRRTLNAVQDRPGLDHQSAFRVGRTRVRFVIRPATGTPATGAAAGARFTIRGDSVRTLRLTGAAAPIAAQIEFCEDLARHDWLLSALLSLVERSRIGTDSRSVVIDRLTPALDHLLHLWMPAARTDAALAEVWRALEVRPGLSRQWQVNVDRIRDQVALGLLERLGTGSEGVGTAHGE